MDFLRITHPDIARTASCSADAYTLIYQAKGWQLVTDDATPAAPQTPEPIEGPDATATATEPPAPPAPAPMSLLES